MALPRAVVVVIRQRGKTPPVLRPAVQVVPERPMLCQVRRSPMVAVAADRLLQHRVLAALAVVAQVEWPVRRTRAAAVVAALAEDRAW